MNIAECRRKDPKCSTSRLLAIWVRDSAKNGKTVNEIEANFQSEAEVERERLSQVSVNIRMSGATFRGAMDARVTIVEFADFECPYCAEAQQTVKKVLARFPRDVRVLFKHYPLPNHPHSKLAARAALAAEAQGRLWPMHDVLFEHYREISEEHVLGWAAAIGLDAERFSKDLMSDRCEQELLDDIAEGGKIGVDGTPAFFINGRKLLVRFTMAAVADLIVKEIQR